MIILFYFPSYNESFMKTGVVLVFFTTASLAFCRVSGKQVLKNVCWMNKWVNYGDPAVPWIQTGWHMSTGLEGQVYLIHYRKGETSLERTQSKEGEYQDINFAKRTVH